MKSRISVIVQKACLVISAIGCVISIIALPDDSIWRTIFLVALSVSCGWHMFNTACPHCGRVGGLKPKPFAKDAGVCVHCHEPVEYR